VTINTPRSKAVIGYGNKRTFDLEGVRITMSKTRQDWAAITLTVMQGNDFKSAARVLITATSYVESTNRGWKNAEKSTVGKNWGKAPVLVEGINAVITPCLRRPTRQGRHDDSVRRDGLDDANECRDNRSVDLSHPTKTEWRSAIGCEPLAKTREESIP